METHAQLTLSAPGWKHALPITESQYGEIRARYQARGLASVPWHQLTVESRRWSIREVEANFERLLLQQPEFAMLDESRLFPTVSVLPRCQVCGSKPSVHRLGQREARPDYVAYCDCEESKTAKHRTADAALREWRITSILRAR